MRKIVIIVMTLISHLGLAQMPVETLVGNKQTHFIGYWQKDIDSAGKFNFFSLNRFAIDREDKIYNNFAIEGQMTYQFKNWLGLSVGGAYAGNDFVPTVGLSLRYANEKGDFYLQSFPTVNLDKVKTFNFFGIVGYTPKLNKTFGLFTQLIFSTNLQLDKTQVMPDREILGLFTGHNQSNQLLRIGLDYKEKVQFGFGADFNQFYKNQGNFSNMGVFIRMNL
jgi:hypothetical protein